jgi:molecular chaperone HscB
MSALGTNHFELFGLPVRFAVQPEVIERAYKDIQGQVHPDRFSTASDAERRVSMQWAVRANEAYETLRDPLKRARYMLALRGIDPQAETNTTMPHEFLMTQMEWREAIEEAQEAADVTALERLLARLRREIGMLYGELERHLDQGEDQPAAGIVRQLMFFDKVREEIDAAFAEIES